MKERKGVMSRFVFIVNLRTQFAYNLHITCDWVIYSLHYNETGSIKYFRLQHCNTQLEQKFAKGNKRAALIKNAKLYKITFVGLGYPHNNYKQPNT